VVIPADVGVTFGTGEKIEGNDTDLTLTSGGDIILDADGADVTLKDGGTTYGSLKQASGHLVIQPTSSKEIILNDQAGTAALTVDTSGQDVSINNGSIVISTAGQGIMFHPHDEAVTGPPGSDSNLLDDYETGTWTPVLNSFATTGTVTPFGGIYTKIGNIVYVECAINATAGTLAGTGGTSYISGLPFAGGYVPGGWCVGDATQSGVTMLGNLHIQLVNNMTSQSTYSQFSATYSV